MAESQAPAEITIVSPLGTPATAPVELATRLTPPRPGPIVLFDNGKLDPAFGNFLAIFDVVAAELRERLPDHPIVRMTVDLLATGDDPVAAAQRYLAAQTPAGVILALADSGVTQRTVELARRLEAAGTPAVVVATPPGTGLARAIVEAQIPGLPIVDLDLLRTHTRDEVAQLTGQNADEIIGSLTRSVAEQWVRSARPGEELGDLAAGADGRVRWSGAPSASADPNAPGRRLAEQLEALGLGDGLPVYIPDEASVAAMLASADRDPDDVLFTGLVPSGIPVTVRLLAANAVLAGCRPEYFPVVLAAFEAMTDPRYRLSQAAITSHPSGNLILVSGPLADRIGIAGGAGCLGPGHRANLGIGRAITLTLINVGRIRPGEADLAGFGSPAEIGYCLAENRAASPWSTFGEDHYGSGETCVLVHRCEAPHNVIDHLSTTPEGLLTGIASVAATLGANNAYQPAELIVMLNPEHAHLVAQAGWTKRDIQLFLWDEARNPAVLLAGRGLPANRRRSR